MSTSSGDSGDDAFSVSVEDAPTQGGGLNVNSYSVPVVGSVPSTSDSINSNADFSFLNAQVIGYANDDRESNEVIDIWNENANINSHINTFDVAAIENNATSVDANYFTNKRILKIGHLSEAIAHAKTIAFAKWSVWVKN